MHQRKGMPVMFAIIAILGWLALLLQFYLIIKNRVAPIPETIIRYFGFFTILTNILVALCSSALLFKSSSSAGNFFLKPTTITAITVYITIVGVVYNLILRFLWNPQGLEQAVDELLHTVIPALFILAWLRYIPKALIQWKNIFPWLIFPFLYLLFVIIRGSFVGYYPYPFLDAGQLGYGRVLMNSLGMLAAFILFSILFIAIDRLIKRNSTAAL